MRKISLLQQLSQMKRVKNLELLLLRLACLVLYCCYNSNACDVRSNAGQTSPPKSAVEVVTAKLKHSSYNKNVRPGLLTGETTVVILNAHLISLSDLSERNMDVKVMAYFRQLWQDRRLSFNDTQFNESARLTPDIHDLLWVPDIYSEYEKNSVEHDFPTPNRLIWVDPHGNVLKSQRVSLTVSCKMQLHKFPLDNQTCALKFESYGHTVEGIKLRWHPEKGAVVFGASVELPEFLLTGSSHGTCDTQYAIGLFPCIFVNIHLTRRVSYWMMNSFIPNVLVVVLSWISFWLDTNSAPARVSIGLLTVLTLCTQASGIAKRLPEVSYIKAIDVWNSACLVFVVGALLEYAAVSVLERLEENKTQLEVLGSVIQHLTTQATPEKALMTVADNDKHTWETQSQAKATTKATKLDKTARVFFPITFVFFVAIFWIIYMYCEFPKHEGFWAD